MKNKPDTNKGFIQIACGDKDNDILMALAGHKLGGTELSVVLCVIRKTWGWKKKEDWISLTQFEEITKRSRQAIINAINQLVKKNILVKKTVPGVKTVYCFNKIFSSWDNQPVKKTVPVQKTSTTSKENCTSLVKKTRPTKDTITKDTIQKKRLPREDDIKSIDIKKIQIDYNVPESFVLSCWDDVMNYSHSHGKKYSDFNRTLRNFVKRGAFKIRKEHDGKSKISAISL